MTAVATGPNEPGDSGFRVRLSKPFLVAEFSTPQHMLSWSLTRPGFVTATRVAWMQVDDADLGLNVDPVALLDERLRVAGFGDAVGLMTSRDVARYVSASAREDDVCAACLATVGLANAGRIGQREAHRGAGTINLLLHVSRPLNPAALVELLAIAVEARTAALLDQDWRVQGHVVTGTGTDCVVVAAPALDKGDAFAGQHTAVGTAAGRAVMEAVSRGARDWIDARIAAKAV